MLEAVNKYKDVTLGTIEAVFNKLGGTEGAARLQRGELIIIERPALVIPRRVNLAKLTALAVGGTVSMEDVEKCLEPKWTINENGVIYITLPPTTGRTGREWIVYFEQKGVHMSNRAKSVLRSNKFQPTTGVVNRIAVLPATIWKDDERFTKRIRQDAYAGTFANGQKLVDPNAEVSCLIRDCLTGQEIKMLDLWYIVGMHAPIEDFGGRQDLLFCDRKFADCNSSDHSGDDRLDSCCGSPDTRWGGNGGFAFLMSQSQV